MNMQSLNIDFYNGIFREKGLKARLYYGLFTAICFFILWALIAYWVFTRPGYEQFSGFMPIPTMKALYHLFFESYFWASVWASLRRVFIGIMLAFIIGLPCGLLIGFYRYLKVATYTPVQFLRMISPLSWMVMPPNDALCRALKRSSLSFSSLRAVT